MRKRNSIVNLPLALGVVLSIALHAAAFYGRGMSAPAKPMMDAGRTVVQLTLVPSAARQPVEPEPEPVVEPEREIEPAPEPIATPEPAPAPKPIVVPPPTPEPAPAPAVQQSVERVASLVEDKGVRIEASPVAGIRATYPRSSRSRGHEGTVLLSIQVRANGQAGEVRIMKSSGFKRLDEAAVKAAKAAEYIPAKRLGRAVESELIQPIVFELTQ